MHLWFHLFNIRNEICGQGCKQGSNREGPHLSTHSISDISFLSFIKSISLWLNSQQSSYLFLILSLISEFGSGTGWTLYPPLSTSFMSLSPSSTGLIIFSLLISGISSCLTSLNFWTTILNLRSYYLTLKTMPLFPYSLFITASMLLLTLPILSGALLLILSDLHSNTLFFDPIFGGDPIFYQHLFCNLESKDNNCLLEIIKLGKSRVERDLVSRQHSFSNPFLIDGIHGL